MSKKSKIVVVVLIIFVVIIGLLGYFVSHDLSVESKLKEEINNYRSDLIAGEEVDPDVIVTTGDYAVVERAIKQYLNDCNTHFNELNNILNNQQFSNNLTIENIQTDGPDFTATKQSLNDIRDDISSAEEVYLNDFKEKTIMSYIEDEAVSNYYKNFYYNLATKEEVQISDENAFDDSIEKINQIIDKQEEMIEFLITNQDNWQIINDVLTFSDSTLATTYSTYTEELNQITAE